MATTLCE
jgi:hypothetical protein